MKEPLLQKPVHEVEYDLQIYLTIPTIAEINVSLYWVVVV